MTRRKLINMLGKGAYKVTFTKVNGDKRVMDCTLMESMIPRAYAKKLVTNSGPLNKEVIAVWCLDKKAFRSFRVENLKKIEPLVKNK